MIKHKRTICFAMAAAFLLCMSLCGCTLPGGKSKLAITDIVEYSVPAGWSDEEIDSPSERAVYKEGEESYIGMFIVKRTGKQQWKDEKTMKRKYKVGKLVKKEMVDDVSYEFGEIDGHTAGIARETYHTKEDSTTRWASHCEILLSDKEAVMIMTKTTSKEDAKIIDDFVHNLKINEEAVPQE